MGLIHAENVVNIAHSDCATTGIDISQPKRKRNDTLSGVQQTKNPRTAAKSNREALMSCARIVARALDARREGAMKAL